MVMNFEMYMLLLCISFSSVVAFMSIINSLWVWFQSYDVTDVVDLVELYLAFSLFSFRLCSFAGACVLFWFWHVVLHIGHLLFNCLCYAIHQCSSGIGVLHIG